MTNVNGQLNAGSASCRRGKQQQRLRRSSSRPAGDLYAYRRFGNAEWRRRSFSCSSIHRHLETGGSGGDGRAGKGSRRHPVPRVPALGPSTGEVPIPSRVWPHTFVEFADALGLDQVGPAGLLPRWHGGPAGQALERPALDRKNAPGRHRSQGAARTSCTWRSRS